MKQTAVEWLVEQFSTIRKQNSGYRNIKTEFKEIIDQLTSIGVLEIPQGSNVVTYIIKNAKEMEKERMCSFAEFVATYPDKNKNYLGEMLHAKSKYDGAERTVDLLEIFKSE